MTSPSSSTADRPALTTVREQQAIEAAWLRALAASGRS